MSHVDDVIQRWRPPVDTPMRTLVMDIETAPTEALIWQLKQHGYIGTHQITEPGYVMSWAAKWVGDDRVMFASTFHDGQERMLERIHQLLSEADAVITYNGVAFDLPTLEWEFLKAEMAPPAPWVDIDLIKSTRRMRKLSNKLDYVCRELGVADGKIDTGGFETWVGCRNGDRRAWSKMKRYNKEDVRITEAVYWRMLPYLRGHPTAVLFADAGVDDRCGFCGSDDVVDGGYEVKKTVRYARYQCRDCGGWSQARTADRSPKPNLKPIR